MIPWSLAHYTQNPCENLPSPSLPASRAAVTSSKKLIHSALLNKGASWFLLNICMWPSCHRMLLTFYKRGTVGSVSAAARSSSARALVRPGCKGQGGEEEPQRRQEGDRQSQGPLRTTQSRTAGQTSASTRGFDGRVGQSMAIPPKKKVNRFCERSSPLFGMSLG